MSEPFVVSDDDQDALENVAELDQDELVVADADGEVPLELPDDEAAILAANVGRQAAGGAPVVPPAGTLAAGAVAAAGRDAYAAPTGSEQAYSAPLHPLPIHDSVPYQQQVGAYPQPAGSGYPPSAGYQPGAGYQQGAQYQQPAVYQQPVAYQQGYQQGGYQAGAPYQQPARAYPNSGVSRLIEPLPEGDAAIYAPPPLPNTVHPGPYDTPRAVTQYPAHYRSTHSPHQGHYTTRPPYDTFSIAALVAGIAGITLLPGLGSILAVVLGIIGLNHARERHTEGRGFALAGLVLGGLSLLFWGLVILIGFLHYSPLTGWGFN